MNTRMIAAAAGLFAAGLLAGCGNQAEQLPSMADVGGTVTFADGKPVQHVQLVMRPKGDGHTAGCPLGSDGKFAVKAIPGEYMYFFQPTEDTKVDKAKAKSAFDAIPAKYRDPMLDRTVTLSAGDGNAIQLD